MATRRELTRLLYFLSIKEGEPMASERNVLKVGDEVLIAVKKGDISATPGMYEYNGFETEVSKICRARLRHNADERWHTLYGYELDGAISEKGVPYVFTREMLQLLEEE